jgi:DNA processing protein
MNREYPYWMAFAHLPKITNFRKNNIIVKLHEEENTIIDLFNSEKQVLSERYELTDDEILIFEEQKKELPNYSFLAEDLLNQGYEIIPITSKEYSPTMKDNLKRRYSPTMLYIKGNKQIMKEKSIAIVGSRNCSPISLEFTDNIAKKASEQFKVVVSGFAKGIDKQALDSAIEHKGQSIIVLPQGIMTYGSGFKKYYSQIHGGDVLVLSIFHPKAAWAVGLAMARNPIIYGLAKEIYVAESSDKGGTWSGVEDGLKKGRRIFIRMPKENEKNANSLLIQKGGIPVDMNGNEITAHEIIEKKTETEQKTSESDDIWKKINALLSKGAFSSKEIIEKLKIDMNPALLSKKLKKRDDVVVDDRRSPMKFCMKDVENQGTLF